MSFWQPIVCIVITLKSEIQHLETKQQKIIQKVEYSYYIMTKEHTARVLFPDLLPSSSKNTLPNNKNAKSF